MKEMYGRARRIKLYIIIAVIVLIIFVTSLFILNLNKEDIKKNVDDNINFSYLIDYFVEKNYSCEMLQKSGGKCYLDVNDKFYQFTRYDNGFEYVIRSNTYILIIKHNSMNGDSISFRTNNNAASGYKDKEYVCKTDNSVIGVLDNCVDDGGNKLELVTYLGVVEQGIDDVNDILNASGYDVSKLITSYIWEK